MAHIGYYVCLSSQLSVCYICSSVSFSLVTEGHFNRFIINTFLVYLMKQSFTLNVLSQSCYVTAMATGGCFWVPLRWYLGKFCMKMSFHTVLLFISLLSHFWLIHFFHLHLLYQPYLGPCEAQCVQSHQRQPMLAVAITACKVQVSAVDSQTVPTAATGV